MALSASTIFEIQQAATASNVNGGGFNPSNTNMLTDLTTDSNTANTSAPVCSSASYNFVAGDVGHWLYIKSGTNWTPGWYKIASVASNKATLSAAIGSANVSQIVNNRFGTNTVAGCATVGTPTSGTFTIDYSQSTASPFASTDIATATSTTLTSATNPFGKNMVGNILHVTAGTGFTAGWYEIVSVSGTTATIDRSIGTHPLTSGTGAVGGAISLGASNDDAVFELAVNSSTASTRFFIKGSATYTTGGSVSISVNATAPSHSIIEGYATTRGDRPTGTTMPLLDCGTANTFIVSCDYWDCFSVQWKIGTASGVQGGTGGRFVNCKATNISTTAGRPAFYSGESTTYINCEGISYRGYGLDSDTVGTYVLNCYFHDSDRGVNLQATRNTVIGSIFVNNKTSGVSVGSSATFSYILGNTFYGAENKLGTGLNLGGTSMQCTAMNNIFYGYVTGIGTTGADTGNYDDYNDFYNNTADITGGTTANWQKGSHDLALNPTFTSTPQRTGSTATTTAGNHLVQTGATFQTWGVTAGVDLVYIVSGTGVTTGTYGILSVDSETQITTDITLSADATANKVWQITTGHNYAIGTNLKALGYPGAFPGALSTGYTDIGAVQRQEAGVAAGGSFTFS